MFLIFHPARTKTFRPSRAETATLAKQGARRCLLIPIAIAVMAIGITGCGPGFQPLGVSSLSSSSSSEDYTGGTGRITVNWSANPEAAVNAAGGGYRVYYTQGTSVTASTPFVNVPFASGAASPTLAKVTGLLPGTYKIFVVAYSTVRPQGSTPSTVATVTVH